MSEKIVAQYNLWTVLKKTKKLNNSRVYLWLCRCICGNERFLQIPSLKNGTSTGCGCYFTDENKRFKNFCKNYEIKKNGCWIWKGSINRGGYGRIGDILVHRYSYMNFKGEIPDGMCVCHNCPGGDNRACCNPEHLWLGTSAENIKDKGPKNRQHKGENQSCSKLKDFQVKEILEKLKSGRTLQSLGEEYSVSHGLISHIKQGRAWKHLT
jgi:hypothetical protein